MAQHTSYWSCSKFADWLRGTPKPYALGWDAWDVWRDEARAAHPFRFWLAEDALGKLQDFVCLPHTIWDNIRHYYHNRFVDQTHVLKTGLKKGQWHEFEDRMLHGLFNELQEFVEIDLAAWDRDGGPRRSKERGLKHLDWEMALRYDDTCGCDPGDKLFGQPTHQAVAAQETLALYRWWTETRPQWPDPFDSMNEDEEEYAARYGLVDEITKRYEKEDSAMMVRLILHRRCLWT